MKYLSIKDALRGLIIKMESHIVEYEDQFCQATADAADDTLSAEDQENAISDGHFHLGSKNGARAAIHAIQKTIDELGRE